MDMLACFKFTLLTTVHSIHPNNLENPRPILLTSFFTMDQIDRRLMFMLRLTWNFLKKTTSIPALKCPPLAALNWASNDIFLMWINPVRPTLMIELAAFTANRYVWAIPRRISLATSRLRLATRTISIAIWRAALAMRSVCLNPLTTFSAIQRTENVAFRNIWHGMFFARHHVPRHPKVKVEYNCSGVYYKGLSSEKRTYRLFTISYI